MLASICVLIHSRSKPFVHLRYLGLVKSTFQTFHSISDRFSLHFPLSISCCGISGLLQTSKGMFPRESSVNNQCMHAARGRRDGVGIKLLAPFQFYGSAKKAVTDRIRVMALLHSQCIRYHDTPQKQAQAGRHTQSMIISLQRPPSQPQRYHVTDSP